MRIRPFVLIATALLLSGCLSNNATTPIVAGGSSSSIAVVGSSAVIASSATSTTPTKFGVTPTTANAAMALQRYADWKAQYYVTVENENLVDPAMKSLFAEGTAGSARIMFDKDTFTVSEGIGYGMLNAYFANDFTAFYRLWLYYKAFRPMNSYLMQWKVYSFYQATTGSATDADIDVATALLLYHSSNPSDTAYLNDALRMINEIYNTEVAPDGSYMLLPGNAGWTGTTVFNPSYFSPVALRLFAKYDAAHPWQAVLDANYNWLLAMNTAATSIGLWPNWANAAGVPAKPLNDVNNTSMFAYFYLEAYRIPWRIAWDYSWFGDARGKTMLTNASNFIINRAGIIDSVRMRYMYASPGTGYGGPGMAGAKGGMCAVATVSSAYQTWLNDCTSKLTNTAIAARGTDYFEPILGILYTEFLNGLYVKPASL